MRQKSLFLISAIPLILVPVSPLSAGEFTESIYKTYVEDRIEDWEFLPADLNRDRPAFVRGSPIESLQLFEKGIALCEREGRTVHGLKRKSDSHIYPAVFSSPGPNLTRSLTSP